MHTLTSPHFTSPHTLVARVRLSSAAVAEIVAAKPSTGLARLQLANKITKDYGIECHVDDVNQASDHVTSLYI